MNEFSPLQKIRFMDVPSGAQSSDLLPANPVTLSLRDVAQGLHSGCLTDNTLHLQYDLVLDYRPSWKWNSPFQGELIAPAAECILVSLRYDYWRRFAERLANNADMMEDTFILFHWRCVIRMLDWCQDQGIATLVLNLRDEAMDYDVLYRGMVSPDRLMCEVVSSACLIGSCNIICALEVTSATFEQIRQLLEQREQSISQIL